MDLTPLRYGDEFGYGHLRGKYLPIYGMIGAQPHENDSVKEKSTHLEL